MFLAARLTAHSDNKHDWKSETQSTHSAHNNKNITRPVVKPLPSRNAYREAQYASNARHIVREAEYEQQSKDVSINEDMRFAHRSPLNKEKKLKSDSPITLFPLNGPAVSIYTQNLGVHTGTTPFRGGVSPFAKATNFSRPIGEYVEDSTRLE